MVVWLACLVTICLSLAGPVSGASATTRPPVTAGTVTTSTVAFDSRLVEYTVELSGWLPESTTFTYQWFESGKAVPGSNQPSMTFDSNKFKNITVRVTGSASGRTSTSRTSTPIKTTSGKVCTLVGTSRDDIIKGTTSADVLCGQGGDDRLIGLAGNDVLDGGEGSDTTYYGGLKVPVTVNLVTQRASSSKSGTDTLLSIENAITGLGADRVTGNDEANAIDTSDAGGDTAILDNLPNDGADIVNSGDGNDVIFTGKGNDSIDAGPGDDKVTASDGDDTVLGGSGTNTCDLSDSYGDDVSDCVTVEGESSTTTTVEEDPMGEFSIYVEVTDPLGAIPAMNYSFFPSHLVSWTPTSTKFYIAVDGSITQLANPFVGSLWTHTKDGRTTRSYMTLAHDTTGPEITSIVADATAVNVSEAGATVALDIVASDNATATGDLEYSCDIAPLTAQNVQWSTSGQNLPAGAECQVRIPQGAMTGDYGLQITVQDARRNETRLRATSTTEFINVKTEETGLISSLGDMVIAVTGPLLVQPDIANVAVDRATVSTATAAQTVHATFDVFGNGLDQSEVVCSLNAIGLRSPERYSTATTSGTATERSASVDLVIPKRAPKGKYAIVCSVNDVISRDEETWEGVTWPVTITGHADGSYTTDGPDPSRAASDGSVAYITNG